MATLNTFILLTATSIPKTTNRKGNVAFPRQQRLRERGTMYLCMYTIYLVWPCMLSNDILPRPLTLNCQTRKFRPIRIPVTSAEQQFSSPIVSHSTKSSKSNTGKRSTQTDYNGLCHSVFLHYRYVNRLRFTVA
jgi:hypothetical protein